MFITSCMLQLHFTSKNHGRLIKKLIILLCIIMQCHAYNYKHSVIAEDRVIIELDAIIEWCKGEGSIIRSGGGGQYS